MHQTIADMIRETKAAALIVNHEGVITFVNAAFENLFKWSQQDVKGRPLTIIIPKSLHEEHQRGFSRFLNTGLKTLMNRPIVLKAVTRDGHIFDAEHLIMAEMQNDRWVFTATIVPIESKPQDLP